MNTSGIHVEIEEWMAGALCGGLSAEEQELFDRHLAECEPCRSLYREEQQMNTMLEKEIAGLRPEPEFGEAMVSRFRERVGQKRRGLEWLGRLAWARPAQALYALLMLAAMVKTGSMMTGERSPLAARTAVPVRMLQAKEAATASNEKADEDALNYGPVRTITRDEPMETAAQPEQRMAMAAADATTVQAGLMAAAPQIDQPAGSVAAPERAQADVQAAASTPAPEDERKLIRNATAQYEVASYSKAADTVAGLIAAEQGYVSTQNSDRGANGKLEGTIELKVPPEHLDALLLKLRVLGDLKSQTLTTQDVTKDYFDTDARMRNAQQEEARLLDILKKNTGKLSELLQVERELARVREGIEEMQGTLKYYNTMVRYATVTIALSEKDLNAPAQFLLKQRADLSIFAGDVEAAFARAKEVAAAAKAQILDSNVERDPNGQTTATLSLLIDPDAADGAIAQLETLGRIQNFTSRTERVAQDGTGTSDTARTEKDKVEAHLTVLQDQETAAQQTDVSVQAQAVETRMAELKTRAAALGAQVKGASFERDPSGTESGTIQLRMPLRAYAGVLAAVENLGEVKNLSVRRQEGATATESAPAEMSVQIYSEPRIVSEENGVWATMRRTLAQAFAAVMWSARMIGVSLAFFAPWLLALAVVVGGVKLARKMRGKAE